MALIARSERRYQRLAGIGRRITVHGVEPGPPAWLKELAAQGGHSIAAHRIALAAPGEFPTQKILVGLLPPGALAPDTIVKIGRHPAVEPRLAAAVRGMQLVLEHDLAEAGTVPVIRFHGSVDGVPTAAESAIRGRSVSDLSPRTADCPWAAATRAWITELGARSARPAVGPEIADGLAVLLERLPAEALSDTDRGILRALLEDLRRAGPVPTVLQHGDPGPWNTAVDVRTGRLSVLDWENAEPRGIPLWDLSYALRSHGVLVATRAGIGDRLARGLYVVTDPTLRAVARDAIVAYARRLAMDPIAIRPILYHHWVYQSLKESTRLPSGDAGRGIFARTLRWLIDHRDDARVREILDPLPQ